MKRTEILLRDLLEGLNRDLTLRSLHRASVEISYRHLVHIALQEDLAQQLLHRTCHGDPTHDLLQTSLQRELAESNLVSQYLFFMFLATLFGLGSLAGIIEREIIELNGPYSILVAASMRNYRRV